MNDHDDKPADPLNVGAGAWKLLSTPNELMLALRDRGDGLQTDLTQLHPAAPVLAGDMSEMQPSDLLNFLHQGRRTGVLLTRSDGVERGIVLIEGNVAWACSTSPGERLGELLARMGLADRARIDAMLREQAASGGQKRLGQLLLDKGALGPEALARGLRHQVNEIFLGLLVARAGTFVFLRGLDRDQLPSILALDTQAMLLDGLRRLDEMELYRTRVPSSELKPRVARKASPTDLLTPEQLQVLEHADGQRTIGDIATATALGEFEATKAAYKLIEAGILTA
ncbi:MAG: DUF4388 domain-containing protein [Myxococcales bacterium]|nr:DUF4388 domain-containing protein [Myxococcales bacterium]